METTTLYIKKPINESSDPRIQGTKGYTGLKDYGPDGWINRYDPKIWNAAGFGQRLQRMFSMSSQFSIKVTDCGQYLSVTTSYHNIQSGVTKSKTFIIVFEDPKRGDGKIFSTSTKWRTISNVDQAYSYIYSATKAMA